MISKYIDIVFHHNKYNANTRNAKEILKIEKKIKFRQLFLRKQKDIYKSS